jgi:hypothetical protein
MAAPERPLPGGGREYDPQPGDANVPIPDPTRLTTQLVDRALAAFREVMETRLAEMDKAIVLAARRIDEMPAEQGAARAALRREVDGEINGLRELISVRLDAMDKATALTAGKRDAQLEAMHDATEGTTAGLREVLETRLAAMDKATELLAATVGRVPSETDKQVNALRELLNARIDGMDKATKLLAETVDRIPTDVDRAVGAATELIQAQLRNVQDTSLEKFSAIDGTFASNALALTAALAAQKEAAAEQNKSNTLAITKSEQATKETITANAAQTATGLTSLGATFADLKERLVRLESMGVGAAGQRTERRLDLGSNMTAGALLLGFLVLAITLYAALKH